MYSEVLKVLDYPQLFSVGTGSEDLPLGQKPREGRDARHPTQKSFASFPKTRKSVLNYTWLSLY